LTVPVLPPLGDPAEKNTVSVPDAPLASWRSVGFTDVHVALPVALQEKLYVSVDPPLPVFLTVKTTLLLDVLGPTWGPTPLCGVTKTLYTHVAPEARNGS
jgi:hypothetical protein